MNIILSGGWGYGNLGDDAILIATLKLLKQKYPTSHITILTYNIEETKAIVSQFSDISIKPSIHVITDPPSMIDLSYNFGIKKIYKPFINKKEHYQKEHKSKKLIQKILHSPLAALEEHKEELTKYSELCKNSNLYIMGGGGYINDWNYSIATKYLEVFIAKRYNLKCYAIGQTIGPFHKSYTKALAQKLFSNIDFMFFRDIESIKDIKDMGLTCIDEVIPDLALFESYTTIKKKQITLIPFLPDIESNIERIGENLKNIVRESGCEIVITVSQLWESQCQIALSVFFYLQKLNLNPQLLIPRNVYELQEIIAQSQYVISQNLHGLILAYRSNCTVISLNSRRKFKSFMATIGAPNRIIEPEQIKGNELFQIFKDCLQNGQAVNDFAIPILTNINKIR